MCSAAMLLSVTACSDFLTVDVDGYSTDQNGYNTQYKLQAALNATYDILQTDQFNSCDWRFGEATADDVWGNDEGLSTQMGQLVNFRFDTNNEWVKSRYEINYKGIHRANQVIAHASEVVLSNTDYSSYRSMRELLGQAKFLRALFYFNLVKTYGGVPIRPEIETVDNLVIPRSTAEEVYAYIERDLREASIMLPARFTGTECGKASAGASLALLMKVLMYQAVPGEDSEKWRDMVTIGRYFVDGQSMTLSDVLKYDKLYEEDWETLRCRLWFKPQAITVSTDIYEGPDYQMPVIKNSYSLEYKNYYNTAMSYIDQFFATGEFCSSSIFEIVFKESADGTDGDVNEGSSQFDVLYRDDQNPAVYSTSGIITEIFGTDPRKTYTIGHQEYTPDGTLCNSGPGKIVSLKWYTPMMERPQYDGDNGKNRRLIRYPEVVLMYAEALNECGNSAESLAQLNKCKTQVNTINGSTALYIGGGYGYIRDQIWKERRMEFAFEWDRFFDLVRQKRAATVIQNYGLQRANKRGYYFRAGVNELFPIPQSEIDISNGVVTQNPGY